VPAGTTAYTTVLAGAADYRTAHSRGARQLPAPKGLLARGESAGVVPARDQAARVDCPRRGHRGVRLHRGGNDGDAEREEEDLGHSFKKDYFAPLNLKNLEDYPPFIFLVYCRAYVLVIICNYMERRRGNVKVTAGPTMLWREIMPHGDATIRRNR
ncbi:hypothetical protein B296_00058495, partial [Ensete ventricosum]